MPTLYVPTADETFDWESDFKICIDGQAPGEAMDASPAQLDASLSGYVDAVKVPHALGQILGYSWVDPADPYTKLRRVLPQRYPRFPGATAYAASATPIVPVSNPDNENGEPYDTFPVAPNLRYAAYNTEIVNVKFACGSRTKWLNDAEIDDWTDEWRRATSFRFEPTVETLSVDGYQLQFAETDGSSGLVAYSAGPPLVKGTPFPCPVPELMPAAKLIVTIRRVAHSWVSSDPEVLYPKRIIPLLGTWNDRTMFANTTFGAGSLLLEGVGFEPCVFPVLTTDPDDVATGWTLEAHFAFAPRVSAVGGSTKRGFRVFPWRANGKFYWAVRENGNDFLPSANHFELWRNANDPGP